jgi:hypothetical protein
MKILTALLAAIVGFFGFKAAQEFFAKNVILIADKEDILRDGEVDQEDFYKDSMDLRGTPTHECVCGSNIWNVRVIFQDFEVAQYFLDMECAGCGSIATAPTLLDKEIQE